MSPETRTFLGFALAPLGAVATVWVLIVAFAPAGWGPRSPTEAFYGWVALLPWVLSVGYLAEAFVGAPLYRELQQRGNSSFVAYLLIGAVSGVAPFIAYGLLSFLGSARTGNYRISGDWESGLAWTALGAACGVASAWVFWALSVLPTGTRSKMTRQD